MTVPVQCHRYTIQEYYQLENDSPEKHEFHRGEILGMSAGSPDHSLIAMNVGDALHQRLRSSKCRAYDSNLRIRIPTGFSFYADASVICGPVARDPDDPAGHAVTNPRLIIEVLSPSTEAYDRGDKFHAYKQLQSLEEYVLISQTRPRVETLLRQADGSWLLASCDGLDSIAKLKSLGIDLPLADVYAGVDFPPLPSAL